MSKTSKVAVPESAGDSIRISYGGDEPVTYKVHDGHVTVQTGDVSKFLGAVAGASVVEGSKSASEPLTSETKGE